MFKSKGVMFLTLVIMLMAFSCAGPKSDQPLLTAELPLHLEEHLDAATLEGSEVPEDLPAPVEWRFDKPQPGWKLAIPINQTTKPVKVIRTEDALRVILNESNFNPYQQSVGGIYIDLPGWHREHWAYIQVRARTSDKIHDFCIGFNLREQPATPPPSAFPFRNESEWAPVITDGSVQTYLIRADYYKGEKWEGKWNQLGIWFHALEPARVDILSVSVIPKEHIYADAPVGVREVTLGNRYRRTLYTHAPGRLEYWVRVPEGGRLDAGLGVVRSDIPVTFRVSAISDKEEIEKVFEETFADPAGWQQRSVDLASYAGHEITLALETEAEKAGTIAFWGAPTVSGALSEASAAAGKPNVIFYVIDGGAAEAMTVYGYNRNTTPNIERLAEQGAVFEYAYSNSSWTDPSTPSFMTSLQDSVLGTKGDRFELLPEEARTMAQHFHDAGYMTGVFTSNAWAGSLNSLQRGVDWLREERVKPPSVSTVHLHSDFWEWRESYPCTPFWVHFQTTDVHGPSTPVTPFAGLFVTPERYKQLREEQERWREWRQANPRPNGPRFLWSSIWEDLGIDRLGWFTTERDVYDEVMAHQDYQLGRFVERLKANGDWENTVLVIAADHSYDAGSTDFGLVLQEKLPDQWAAWGPLLRSTITRVPLIVIWPGHIEAGLRFSEPVSMIDVLPTLLDLAELPLPEVFQGQSLTPLLLGTGSIERRPVIIDEFEIDQQTGELHGLIEVIDGRWGASLAINGGFPNRNNPNDQRPEPLLVYNVWKDPLGLHPINDKRPDLVEKYTQFLKAQFEVHQTLAKLFTSPEEAKLTPDQLETLRSLGYIR